MQITYLDWRQIMNDWSRADILYLRSICDEKIAQLDQSPKRKILIRKEP